MPLLKERQNCTANKKGSVIDCELGNPLQRDAQVSTAADFSHFERQYLYGFFITFIFQSILCRSPSMSYSRPPASRWAPTPSTSLCCWRREETLCHLHWSRTDLIFKWFSFHAGQASSMFSLSMHWPKLLLSWRCRYMGMCFIVFLNTVLEFPNLTFRQLINCKVERL